MRLAVTARATCASGMRRSRLTVRASTEAPPAFAWQAAKAERTKLAANVEGDFWVDATCIDCDTCRMMAGGIFTREGQQSAVTRQPRDEVERVSALQAVLSCPTFSIHADRKEAGELQAAQRGLPALVPGTTSCYACGWRSQKSFACESYLIVREGGNVLVDSPRFNPVLAARLKELGGVKWIFLTHKDDVGDHALWAKAFGAQRILHGREVVPDTEAVEVKLSGEGPWRLPDGGDDVQLVFTPGHTEAHVCLYYGSDAALFSGDHLAQGWGGDALDIFKDFNWFSVPQQLQSVAKLLDYDWLHVLPGHGRPAHLRDAAHRLQAISDLLARHGAAAAPAEAVATSAQHH